MPKLRGNVNNPYRRTIRDVGYYGEGIYSIHTHRDAYERWVKIIQRCYSTAWDSRHPTYIGCVMCEEWENFQNYANWHYENYYSCGNELMHMDKDIIVKGNKLYSPTTCVFVPQRINQLFKRTEKNRGKFPIGVQCARNNGRYRVVFTKHNMTEYLGTFPTPEIAFETYKQAKESYIKEIADEYKTKYPQFPQRLYDAMYAYEVEISD